MIQWTRAPMPSSGSKWNTSRCIQYSVSVQNSVAAQHEADHLKGCGLAAGAGGEQHDDRRHEDQDRHHRMDPRKPIEQVRVEHPRRGLQDI